MLKVDYCGFDYLLSQKSHANTFYFKHYLAMFSNLKNSIRVYVYFNCNTDCEGRKKGNFYLTMHSTHFIYGYMA